MAMTRILEPHEHDWMRNALELLRIHTLHKYGLQRISGGFAEANMQSYNNKTALIKVRSGVSSDCTHDVVTETFRMDLDFLEVFSKPHEKMKKAEGGKAIYTLERMKPISAVRVTKEIDP